MEDLKYIDKMEQMFSNPEADYFKLLSLEILCRIFNSLSLHDVLKLSSQCKKMQRAVTMYLRILKSIDFRIDLGQLQGWMPASLTDEHLLSLIPRCKALKFIYGFHPVQISKRRVRGKKRLSIPGVLSALNYAQNIQGIEVSNIALLGAILNYFPTLKIMGTFRNRQQQPCLDDERLRLTINPNVTSLHLTGISLSELPKMDSVQYLYLNMVNITNPHPFKEFLVPNLHTFVMSNCCGPKCGLSYVPLFAGLAAAQSLSRLELVKVPFMGGLLEHIVEDSWRANGFRRLNTVLFSSCKNALEMDLGYILITAADKLKELSVQPSLTKDSLFSALNMAEVVFTNFKSLYLGYVDPLTESGEKPIFDTGSPGPESPAMITDNGMKAVGQAFPDLTQLEIYNCPHLIHPCTWFSSVAVNWAWLQHLTLRRCHSLRLQDFSTFISHLPRLEILQLEYMFREPPKGCSRVGLSAGTGLGVSSALVQNHGHGNDIVPNDAGDEDQDDAEELIDGLEEEDDINNNDENELNRVGFERIAVPMEVDRASVEAPDPAGRAQELHRNLVGEDNFLFVSPPLPAEPHPLPFEVLPPLPREPPPLPREPPPLPREPPPFLGEPPSLPLELKVPTSSGSDKEISSRASMQDSTPKTDPLNNVDSNLPSTSRGHSHHQIHDFNEPGCSHWNYGEMNSAQNSNKANNVSKIKNTSKYTDKRRVKSVRIISVKCSPPSTHKAVSQNTSNSNANTSNCTTNTSNCNTNTNNCNTNTNNCHTNTNNCNRNTNNCNTNTNNCNTNTNNCNTNDSINSFENNETRNNNCLFDKPPPKYSDIQNDNGMGSNSENVPPPEYGHPHNASTNSSLVTPNSFNNAAILPPLDVSPPDYNTAMAQGDVLDIHQCSCGLNTGAGPSDNTSSVSDRVQNHLEDSEHVEIQGNHERAKTENSKTGNPNNCVSVGPCSDDSIKGDKNKKISGKRKRRSNSDQIIDSFYHDQACQAHSEEIREETQKAEEEYKKAQLKKNNGLTRSSPTRQSLRKNQKKQSQSSEVKKKETVRSRRSSGAILKRKRSVHHKATSTSDPVMEDDHIQVLLLRSDSLVSVKLHMVGITDLIVEDCPELTYISGSACRVLKKVTIYSAPKLKKTQFVQCKKLHQTHLVNEVCDQISEKNRMIFLRPMHQFDQTEFEEMLFQQPDICYYLGVIYDYSPCPNQTLYNRNRVTNMLELFVRMNIDLVRVMDFGETSWYRMDAYRYPWKRDIYRLGGLNSNGSRWEMITDIPWIRMLSQCPDKTHPKQVLDDKKAGIYSRGGKGHFTKQEVIDELTLELADFRAANQTFFVNSIIVYFNMCDTSGVPTPDLYL